jgi:hypothetical protein
MRSRARSPKIGVATAISTQGAFLRTDLDDLVIALYVTIDDLFGPRRRQAQHPRRHQEAIGVVRWRCQAQRGSERLCLWCWEPAELVQQWPQQLVEGGKRQLRFGLHPAGVQGVHAVGCRQRVGQQRRLADPGLTRQDQGVAAALAGLRQQPVDACEFCVPAVQHAQGP